MAPLSKTVGDIIRDAFNEPSDDIVISNDYIEARVAELRDKFQQMREGRLVVEPIARETIENDTEYLRDELDEALDALPPARRDGWLAGVKAALKIAINEARETTSILVDTVRDLLPAEPAGWRFAEAVAARSGGTRTTAQLFSVDRPGAPSLQVAITRDANQSRLSVTVSDFPLDAPIPVLLVVRVGGDNEPPIEVDPAVSGTLMHRLQYERELPAGDYLVFLGNPRIPG